MSRKAGIRALVCLAVSALAIYVRCGALPEGFLDRARAPSTVLVDRNGEILYEALSPDGTRSRGLSPDALPDTLVNATLAAEDHRFFAHPGVDALAVLRAMGENLRAGRIVQGGSTLTQQVVKMLTRRERSFLGKLREAVLALRLEHRLTKREILALYLNLAPYGNQYAGASAASMGYFGLPVESLTPAQAAFLAGLPQRPSAFDPYLEKERAKTRAAWVLGRMRALGLLSAADHQLALGERLVLRKDARAFLAPHFVQYVLSGVLGRPERVETTLDAELQREVQGILETHRRTLARHGARHVAVAVLRNDTAEWLAWEGSGNWEAEEGGAIDGVMTPRQPGSALKPFTYALAFERGLTPASVLPDLPSHFPTAKPGVLYSPRNYDGVFRGPLRARAALAGSENVPAVWALSRSGVPALLRLLRSAGLTTLDKEADFYGYGLTMGDAEVSLGELVAAYAALGRGGLFLPARRVRSVDGRSEPDAVPERILSERAAFWVTDILQDARARAYIFGAGGSLDFPFAVAVKTGTSQAYRDNWTIGYTRDVTVGVWVGNFDRTPLVGSSGVTGAGPIFHDVLLAAQKRVAGRLPSFSDPPLVTPPSGLTSVQICALSGDVATRDCPRVQPEWLPLEGAGTKCAWHWRVRGEVRVAWPPRYRAWAFEHGREAPVVPEADARPGRAERTLSIENPPPDAVYLIDPTLRPEFQALPLSALTAAAGERVVWSVDGVAVGESGAEVPLDWPLVRGAHVVRATDAGGRSAQARILVK